MVVQGFSRQAPDSIPACVVFGLDTAKKSVPATVLERSWVDVPDASCACGLEQLVLETSVQKGFRSSALP